VGIAVEWGKKRFIRAAPLPTCFFLSELESSTCDGKGLLGFLCTGFVIFVSIIVCRFCFQRYSSAKLEKAVCQAATINQFQGIDSFVQETYEHQKSRSEKAPKRCFDEKKPIGKSTKKAGCTGVYSAVPNVPTPKSELVKKIPRSVLRTGTIRP